MQPRPLSPFRARPRSPEATRAIVHITTNQLSHVGEVGEAETRSAAACWFCAHFCAPFHTRRPSRIDGRVGDGFVADPRDDLGPVDGRDISKREFARLPATRALALGRGAAVPPILLPAALKMRATQWRFDRDSKQKASPLGDMHILLAP